MKFFSTPNEKKSAIITSLIGFLLILIFFVFGLTFLDPPISYGAVSYTHLRAHET